MSQHTVGVDDFFEPYLKGFGPDFEGCRDAMRRLIDRYDLAGKSVLWSSYRA